MHGNTLLLKINYLVCGPYSCLSSKLESPGATFGMKLTLRHSGNNSHHIRISVTFTQDTLERLEKWQRGLRMLLQQRRGRSRTKIQKLKGLIPPTRMNTKITGQFEDGSVYIFKKNSALLFLKCDRANN